MTAVPTSPLAEIERRALLLIARRALLARCAGGPPPGPASHSGGLGARRGVFVTLRVGGALRGCIGVVQPDRPLAQSVAECTAAAACEDPRFAPLRADEAQACSIEISILEPPFVVVDPGAIDPGRHGLIVTRGRRRGLLLPQVAVEQCWDRETFLRETCRKAGLEPGAWERGALVEAFTVERVSEEGATAPPPSPPRPPRSPTG